MEGEDSMTEQAQDMQATQAGEAAAPKAAPQPAPAGKVRGPYVWGTGRRKSAVARVRIRPGGGAIQINKRPMEEFFRSERDRNIVRSPLEAAKLAASYDVWVNVNGGGTTGQADAVMLGLARALIKAVPESSAALRNQGLLTRDARARERKKPGQPGARKRFQFSKR
jgi:small subunit ribosomal protein S9